MQLVFAFWWMPPLKFNEEKYLPLWNQTGWFGMMTDAISGFLRAPCNKKGHRRKWSRIYRCFSTRRCTFKTLHAWCHHFTTPEIIKPLFYGFEIFSNNSTTKYVWAPNLLRPEDAKTPFKTSYIAVPTENNRKMFLKHSLVYSFLPFKKQTSRKSWRRSSLIAVNSYISFMSCV